MSERPQAQASAKPVVFFGGLDGHRAIGTFVVVMHHLPFIFFRAPFAYSWWAVQSFFVISGFLLTRILLKEKDKGFPFLKMFKSFMLKRIYRIFPLYWAFLAFFGLIFMIPVVAKIPLLGDLMREYKQNWMYLWSYTYNYKEMFNVFQGLNANLSPFFSHLWSLSVEEQFYFILPVLVFITNRTWLKRIVLAIIILSPVIRFFTFQYFEALSHSPQYAAMFKGDVLLQESWLAVIILRSTWTQLDCLAFGMALALWDFSWIKSAKKAFFIVFAIFAAIVTINAYFYIQHLDLTEMMASPYFAYKKVLEIFPLEFAKFYIIVSDHLSLLINYQYVYMYTIVNILSFLLVLGSIRNKPILDVMTNDKVVYTGKITYGAYLFHYPLLMMIILFLGPIFGKVAKKFGQIPFELSVLAVYLPMLWALSHLSFKYFETYFINLKAKVK